MEWGRLLGITGSRWSSIGRLEEGGYDGGEDGWMWARFGMNLLKRITELMLLEGTSHAKPIVLMK